MSERSTPRGHAPERRAAECRAARAGLATLLAVLCVAPPNTVSERAATSVALAPAQGPATAEAPNASVHYRQAEAHATDVVAFEPGERVRVPFTPRADDDRPVDGQRAVALPAGAASGREIRNGAEEATAPADMAVGPAVGGDLASTVSTEPSASGGSDGPQVTQSAVIGPGGLRREVFGFLPYWQLDERSTVLDWRTLTTVAYFSVGCTSSGGLWKRNLDGSLSTGWAGWTSSTMTDVIEEAHRHGTRVVLTVSCFAWSGAGASAQASLLGSPAARATLARQAAAAIRARGADGVNLDFEPILPGYEEEFTALVRAVRRQLNAIAPGYQLTFDAMGSLGNQPIAEATGAGAADAVVIMGYDYRTAASSVAGSISPLEGPAYDLTDTIEAFTTEVPPSRLILGVPYYGRAWSTATKELHGRTLDPGKYGSPAEPYYAEAADLAELHGRRYDRVEKSPWAVYRKEVCTTKHGCVTTWRQMYYDDARSLKLRYDLVNRAGLRGAAIWALGYDGARPELREAILEAFESDEPVVANETVPATPPMAGIETLPHRVRDEGFKVSWTGAATGGIATFDVEVSVDAGAFEPWITGTTRTSSIMLGTHGRTYAFRVRATDVDGATSAWQAIPAGDGSVPDGIEVGGVGRVVVDGLNLRASPTTTATIRAKLEAGTALRIIGGPVRREGYSWFKVTGPVAHSLAIDAAPGGWVAAFGNGVTHLVPRAPVNATRVDAEITTLRLADGGPRVLRSDGGGRTGTLALTWTNRRSFDALTLAVYRTDGSLLGTVALPAEQAQAGARRWTWDGRVEGEAVAAGSYVLQLQARAGSRVFYAPSAEAVSDAQIERFGVEVGPVPSTSVLEFTAPDRATASKRLTWRLRFAGPIHGLAADDFVRAGTATGCRIEAPTGSGATWSVTLSGCSAGSVRLALKPDVVADGVRNWGPEAAVPALRVRVAEA